MVQKLSDFNSEKVRVYREHEMGYSSTQNKTEQSLRAKNNCVRLRSNVALPHVVSKRGLHVTDNFYLSEKLDGIRQRKFVRQPSLAKYS